ncbi:hypothetical protein Athai_12090 [Actinocatenispora thailandica]|uniref:Uncharacterized protein n=1 Tax=Actinocatenispora thailandica TaxID=227318 RepID=A0A7R7DLI9_9ACTN|nr:hypothetical protein Athai_12090 [Actinocatenispora thailandica]
MADEGQPTARAVRSGDREVRDAISELATHAAGTSTARPRRRVSTRAEKRRAPEGLAFASTLTSWPPR